MEGVGGVNRIPCNEIGLKGGLEDRYGESEEGLDEKRQKENYYCQIR